LTPPPLSLVGQTEAESHADEAVFTEDTGETSGGRAGGFHSHLESGDEARSGEGHLQVVTFPFARFLHKIKRRLLKQTLLLS
jgi:hypothetical protein